MMSSADERGQPIAARTGADLRAARERLGWALPDVASHLRIRLPFLECLESGRIAELPGNAYAVGFVRTYARALGLDPDEMARRFRAEAAAVNRKTQLDFPAPVPERGVPAGALVLLGATLCIGAYVAWYRLSADRPSSAPVANVPERLAVLADPPAAQPAAAVLAVAKPPAPSPASSPALAPAPVATTAPVPAAAPAPPAAPLSAPSAAAPVAAAQPPAPPLPAASPTQAMAAPSPVPAPGKDVALRARSDSWLQIRDPQGQMLLSRVLRAGEVWPLPGRGPYLVTTGNAGGTEVLVDGVAIGNFGAEGAVRRDIPLDADTIREARLLPPVPLANAAPAKVQPAPKQP